MPYQDERTLKAFTKFLKTNAVKKFQLPKKGDKKKGKAATGGAGAWGVSFKWPREGRCVHVLFIPCLISSPEIRREPRGALGTPYTVSNDANMPAAGRLLL